MKQYLDLVRTILDTGTWQENRTGIRTISMPGAMLRFDLQQGFPAVTTKKLAFKSAVGELVGFLRASRSAADFRDLGCKVWDANANQNPQWLANPYRQGADDLGDVYGVQWRQWPAYKVLEAGASAQLADATARGFQVVTEFEEDGSRKVLLYKAIDQLRQIALPACHLLYQFLPNVARREISLCLYIRSNDVGLGTPFNLTEGAALLHLVGRLTGYTPRWFTYFIGDAHIYENQLDMLQQQLTREPYESPAFAISDRVPDYAKTGVYEPEWLEKIEPSDFSLVGYRHHEPLTAPMAV
jgi:thymidylate synthase